MVELNLPAKPTSPKIKPGDYLSLDVGGDKDLQIKSISANSKNILVDPAGYRLSKYDQSVISWLAGQALNDALASIKSNLLDAIQITSISNISSSGYYYVSSAIAGIDSNPHYVECHMIDKKNGVILILGTSFFCEIKGGVVGSVAPLKGGEKDDF